MKTTSYLLIGFVLLSGLFGCKEQIKQKDYVTFSGTITNPASDTIFVRSDELEDFEKIILLDENGAFSDTFKVINGFYYFLAGEESADLYLKNGDQINVKLNTEMFDETIKYTGKGAQPNNYIAKKYLFKEGIQLMELVELTPEKFDSSFTQIEQLSSELLEKLKGLDSAFVATQEQQAERYLKFIQSMFESKQIAKNILGKPSPTFTFPNIDGQMTSLENFKGKYVYIDVWATWCAPCRDEIPSLKKLEEDFRGKNIEFVSISVDNKKDTDKWKNMVETEELAGQQLIASDSWKSPFIKGYGIRSIPRFILIDPEGIVIDSDAPRPSNEDIITVFEKLAL